jgi:hypothetical protein
MRLLDEGILEGLLVEDVLHDPVVGWREPPAVQCWDVAWGSPCQGVLLLGFDRTKSTRCLCVFTFAGCKNFPLWRDVD